MKAPLRSAFQPVLRDPHARRYGNGPINDPPSFTGGGNVSSAEDAGAQSFVSWATAIDDGDPNQTQVLTFNVTGNTNPGLFSVQPAVNPNTGELTYTSAANANGSSTITLTLSDDGGGNDTSAPYSFTITVTPVNDAPSFTGGGNVTSAEGAGAQTVAGWATAIADNDPEVAQALTFNVTGNTNPSLFTAGPAVSTSTGDLTYTTTGSGSATITLTLSDDGGGSDTSAPYNFTITVTPSIPTDPNFGNVVSLLHMNGADGSTTFTDVIGKVWSVAGGTPQIDTGQSKFGGASLQTDNPGSGNNYITTPDSADWDFGTGDFTVELHFRASQFPSSHTVLSHHTGVAIQFLSSTSVRFLCFGAVLGTFASSFSLNTWYHLAITRSGTSLRCFVDGVQIGSTVTDSTNITGNTAPMRLGSLDGSNQPFYGHIDEVRITKGFARYTANFTPPAAPYPDA